MGANDIGNSLVMRSKSHSQLEYKYLPIVTDKERGRRGGNFEEVSPFFEMTLTVKVLAEHKVSPRERNECFFEPKCTGATCKYAGFSMHGREAVTTGRGRRQAVDSCRRTRRWHLT